MQTLSEQEEHRRAERQAIQAMGLDPYPARSPQATHTAALIKSQFEHQPEGFDKVVLTGRIMSRRIQGKVSFAELQDQSGRLQLYLSRDVICPGEDKNTYNQFWKKLLDIGDIIAVEGDVFKTQVGEITLNVQSLTLLSKSLRPLPMAKTDQDGTVHDAFQDPEQRYRQRYVDLIVNPAVKATFRKRTKMVQAMRQFLIENDFLEVETPILQPLYGGAAARPFTTHHNTLDMPLYLRIANELYLKRLIVGGFDRVFEFAKDFRNEGMSRFHNPEFTQVELYAAYQDYAWMMDFVEEMLEKVALAVHGSTEIKVGDHLINFKRPWKRYTMFEAIQHYTGTDIADKSEEELKVFAKECGVEVTPDMGYGKLIDEIFGAQCEPQMIQPTFVTDYPVAMSPLAKRRADQPDIAERFEAICNGKEICNAFSELNDPIDQRERFEAQVKLREAGDGETMPVDEDFLRALEHGMPPTAGLGIGIDRLAMIMTNTPSIQEVLFFPQMRPEKKVVGMSKNEYQQLGIPEDWVPVLQQLNLNTLGDLQAANPNKLHNDLCGRKKKMKLQLQNPRPEDVTAWIQAAQARSEKAEASTPHL